MTRWAMVIDLQRCVGCNACTVACKAENGTPQGVFYCMVLERMTGTYPDAQREFIPVLCNHCEEPPCQKVCPTGATYTRDDGIVLADDQKCIGCRACYVACPYNRRYFLRKEVLRSGYYGELTPYERTKYAEHEPGTVVKCTFCAHRVDQGLEPACVITCCTRARIFGDLDDPESEVSRIVAQERTTQLLPEAGTEPRVFYLR